MRILGPDEIVQKGDVASFMDYKMVVEHTGERVRNLYLWTVERPSENEAKRITFAIPEDTPPDKVELLKDAFVMQGRRIGIDVRFV